MPSKSVKQQRFFRAVKRAKHNPSYGDERLRKVANSMTDSDIDDFANHLAELKTKKAMLAILKEIQEDVSIREPMYLDEEDEKQAGIEPIAQQFITEENWAKYIGRYVGQPLDDKELEAISNFKEETNKEPMTVEGSPVLGSSKRVTDLWYKTKDDMNVSKTTLIRKMKDGGQFSYIAFQKHITPETPEEKEKKQQQSMNAGVPPSDIGELPPLQEVGEMSMGPQMAAGEEETPTPTQPSPEQQQQAKEKAQAKENIVVTKSILFKDAIKGGSVLIEFLKKLDL